MIMPKYLMNCLTVHRSGKTGAEIITPRVIAKLLPLLLNIQEGTVYDGSFGTGRLLAYAYRYAKENGCKIKLVGQEINARAKWVFPVQIKDFIGNGIRCHYSAVREILWRCKMKTYDEPRFFIEGNPFLI